MTTALGLETCQTKYGKFIFPKNDIYIGRSLSIYGQYCESEIRLFKQILRTGDIAVDAGANIGAFAIPISKMLGETGMLYAFEPQPYLCSILSANLLANDCINTRAMSIALSDGTGKITVQNIDYKAKNNFGGISFASENHNFKADSGHIGIAKMRLDDVISIPRLRFIKADVEGMELTLIKGASQLINRYKPYLYLECNKPESADALCTYLDQFNYQYYWHISPFFDADNWRNHKEDIFGNVSCVNLLCAPQSTNLKNFIPANGTVSHPRYEQ